jgi:predicted ATPase
MLYTAHFLSLNENKTIPNSKLSHPNVKTSKRTFSDPETQSQDLIDQVEAWMGEISPGTSLNVTQKPDVDLVSIRYSYGNSKPYRATNVGFGISYTL